MSGPETRHLPLPDAETTPFWDATAEGRLLLRHCRACDRPFFYPRARCPRCLGDDVDWRTGSGRGHIHSYTTVHQNHARPFRERLPYVVVLVELEEGPRMLATLDAADAADVAIDREVVVTFREEEGVHLPVFVPASR